MDVSCAPRFIEFELDDEEDCTYNEEEYDPEEEPFDEDDCPACFGPHRYGDTTGSVGFAVRKLLAHYAD